MMLALAVASMFVAVFLLAVVVSALWETTRRSRTRLMRGRFATADRKSPTARLFRNQTMSGLPLVHRWLSRASFAATLGRSLEQAGISQPVGVILGAMLLLAIVGGHVVWRLTASWMWSALGVGGFGCLPLLYVRRRKKARLALYVEQLPDALDVLTRSLRAGQSFLQGVQAAAREMPDPAGTEFRMTFEELRLGRSLREALQSHANRVECLDFNLIATALLIQREVGGNLTEILENSSQTIRERYKLLGQIRALAAQNWLAGRIISLLPFAIGVMIYVMRPELILVLFKEEIGRLLMVLAVAMQIAGFFVMKRIMTIKI